MTDNEKFSFNAEYGVDSRYKSVKEEESDATALMEARLIKMKTLSKEQIVRAKLLQLKLKMEEYVNAPVYDHQNHFTDFLKMYVDTIYSQRISFAKDIEVDPVSLSQVINNHREPNDEFFMKLMIHVEKAYMNVSEFPRQYWLQVYYQQKISNIMSNQEQWKSRIQEHVKFSEVV